MFNIHNI